MSEVLSQSQIDALLNAVRSGDKDLDQSADEPAEKKYRKYDFHSPRKFTKDRIKMLHSVFDNYARIVNSRLNAMIHTNCEMEVESIEEQRYYEFSNALVESDILALAQVKLKDKIEDTPMMLYLSTGVVLNMFDHMLGGGDGGNEDIPLDYSFTDLELQLYESIVKDMIATMGGSWENYISIDFEYSRTEVTPTLSQFIGLDEIVVIVDMKIQFPNSSGRLSVCLPGIMLTDVFTEISKENPTFHAQGEDNSEDIFDSLRDSRLEIVAQLGHTQMSLQDVFHLNVGDVIDLGQSKDEPMYLEIGGSRWFSGRMGTYKKNMAIKIEDVCYQADQRSE